MIVAAVQCSPSFLDVDANLQRIETLIESCDAEIIVLPELCLSGYCFSSFEELAAASQRIDDRIFAFLSYLAHRKSCAIVLGFAEHHASVFYNSAALITSEGIAGIYRKVHLFGEEPRWFAKGDGGFHCWEWKGIRIGMMICFDWRFPESARSLALRGADVICHPSNLVSSPAVWRAVLQTRANDNRLAIVTANRIGEETCAGQRMTFTGQSMILDRFGSIVASADAVSEQIVRADVDLLASRDKSLTEWNHLLHDRRPEMYADVQ